VLGRTVRVHGTPLTIVGVMPPVRAGMLIGWGDLWSPLRRYDIRQQRATQYRSRYLSVVARLRPGVTLAQSRGRMTTLQHHLAQEATSVAQGFEARVDAIETTLVGGMRPVLFLVLVAAGLAYLAACANVGNLMFARAVGRERETAMRLALGASRGRVLTAALAEGAVLSLFGFALGLVVARVSLFAIVAANADIPRFDGTGVDGGLDGRVLAFAAISAVAAMLLASAAPLVGVRLRSLQLALREGGRAGASGARNRVRSAFVAAQIALACVLVIGAGLLTVSLARLMHIDPGFRARGAVIADFNNPRIWSSKDAERALATRDMLRHLSEQPGISAAGILLYFPYHPKLWQATAFAEGATPRPGEETAVYYNLFAGEYFRAMGIPLLAGRLPTESEMWEPSTRVAVVNAAFARTVFGSPSPIGKRFHPGQGAAPVTVIGVVGDVRQRRLDDPPRAEYYVPFSSMPMPFGTLVVRGTSRDGSAQADVATARRVAAAMRAVEPGLAAARVLPLESFVAASERDRRVAMVTLFMFAVTTALLAALGLYGVMSYAVVERRPEIGVRMALGATSARIVRQFVGHGLRSAAVGIASGVLLAVILSRMLASLLYGVDWLDAMVFVAAPLALTLLAIAVSTIPAARAARGNPTAALRG
jgi:predicted permease